MTGWNRVGAMVLAGSLALLTVGCGGPSRAERAQAEKDAQIRRYQEEQAAAAVREKALMEQQQLALAQNQKQAMTLQEMATRSSQAQMAANQKMDALQVQLAEMEKRLGARPGGDIEVVRADKVGAITIRVANSVLFDVGKADLKESSHAKLQEVAKLLRTELKENFVRVEGHTDSTPIVRNKEKFADNMELSQARSKAVFDYLIKSCSLPANRMYTAGYAYSQPVVWPEKTTADRAKNRRVDIVILPNIKVEKESVAASK